MPEVPSAIPFATEALNELSLEVNIESTKFINQPDQAQKLVVSNIDGNGNLITGVTFKELNTLVPQGLKFWGDYVLTNVFNKYSGYITLTFAKHKSTTPDPVTGLIEKLIPYRITPTFGNHYWHPILQSLVFIEDNNFPRATSGGKGGQSAIITGPTYYSREVYQPSVSEGTRFLKQEFFADTPFEIPSYMVPIPTAVSFDLPGLRGSFPECLHPKIVIPDTRTVTSSFVVGSQLNASGALSGQRFPETNFTEWRPYNVSAQQEYKNGGWYMAMIRVVPPLVPERIIK